jgi:hypothetical protein
MKGQLVGYCSRCGGDCFDEVRHRCPPKHPLVSEMIALKFACDKARAIMSRRAWARVMAADDVVDLKAAVDGMLEAMGRASRPNQDREASAP